MTNPVCIRLLQRNDDAILDNVAPGVFDAAINPALTREFLDDSRHHIAVALDARLVVGMATALHYVHPDKPAELWINEVGVAERWRRRGIARALLQALFAHARSLGCAGAWVGTERDNEAAMALYRSLGGSGDEAFAMFDFDVSG